MAASVRFLALGVAALEAPVGGFDAATDQLSPAPFDFAIMWLLRDEVLQDLPPILTAKRSTPSCCRASRSERSLAATG